MSRITPLGHHCTPFYMVGGGNDLEWCCGDPVCRELPHLGNRFPLDLELALLRHLVVVVDPET